ncbi:MAG: hypothetical protein K6G10_11020 [Butyrivibrio sp.]|nr:hypothetical protein [Butyrivibrio sp.]
MKKYLGWIKVHTAVILSLIILLSATGCGYSSFDDYLKALGIMDPNEYEDDSASVITGEEVTASASLDAASLDAEADITASALLSSVETEDEATAQDSQYDTGAADFTYAGSYKALSDTDREADEAMRKAREEMGLTEEKINSVKEQQKGLYAFERLTNAGKTLYAELLIIMENHGEEILVSTTSDEAVELVFDYVMADHPEIFYVDGYQYTNYTMDDVITKIAFTGNYIYSKEEAKERQQRINDYVNKCLSQAPSSEDDYYVIKYVYEYLIDNTEYSIDSKDNQNICSVFIDKKSVCNGYAKATQYLLNRMGIPCTLITGTVDTKNSKNIRHAWNLVLCNNTYYYIDTTWGDSSYQTASGESADTSKLPSINYDYLNVTTKEISKNHDIADDLEVPLCSSMADNYYVREDEYFTSAETALVKDLFDRRYKEGSKNVTLKCSSKDVYDQLFTQLITERKVFEYLQGENSQISYTTFADTGTIIFWIA